jgi:hypothetical protein
MPPTEPKLVGDASADYKFGIASDTAVAFMNVESIEKSFGAQKHEIKGPRGNILAQAFSQMDEKHYALSGQFKGTIPAVGDKISLQPFDEGSAIDVIIQEDLKIGESNSGWRSISATAIHFPDMTFA